MSLRRIYGIPTAFSLDFRHGAEIYNLIRNSDNIALRAVKSWVTALGHD